MRSITCVALAGASLFMSAGMACAEIITFDGALGTTPESQGWTFAGSFAAPMSVGGGELSLGPTSVSGTTYWEALPAGALDFTTQSASIEATVRLTGADYGNFSGFRRGGFALYLQDDAGRYVIADLGDNAISLGNDNNRTSDPEMAFDLTSAFRTVRLEAGPGGGVLYVDGVQMLTIALGSGSGGLSGGWWGEGTILANADLIEVQRVQYIPAPGAAAGLLCGVAAALRRRR